MVISIKEVEPTEIKQLCRMARDIWTEHYTPIIGSLQVEYMLQKFQSPEAVRQYIKEGYKCCFILLDGNTAGYIMYKADKELFLSKLYVEKQYRNRGCAAAAIDFLKSECRAKSIGRVWLTVNKNNTGSIAAYKKLGFNICGECKTDIGCGFFMDDYIMELIVN
ncbi:MAG TPA: GNAT family N-acetyltransferase [Clostridiales bacterium]|nr:GNAT family N-acetyltransferase [Clostridiales bacterium]